MACKHRFKTVVKGKEWKCRKCGHAVKKEEKLEDAGIFHSETHVIKEKKVKKNEDDNELD